MVELTFKDRLQAKIDSGMSQRKLAKLAGVEPQAVTKWLKGGAAKEQHVRALAKGLGESYLYWRDGIGGQPGDGHRAVIETAQEIDTVEYTKESLDVARAYMKLNEKDRRKFKRQIEAEALTSSEPAPDQPGRPPATVRQNERR